MRLEVSANAAAKDLVPDQVGQRQTGRHGRMPVSGNRHAGKCDKRAGDNCLVNDVPNILIEYGLFAIRVVEHLTGFHKQKIVRGLLTSGLCLTTQLLQNPDIAETTKYRIIGRQNESCACRRMAQ